MHGPEDVEAERVELRGGAPADERAAAPLAVADRERKLTAVAAAEETSSVYVQPRQTDGVTSCTTTT